MVMLKTCTSCLEKKPLDAFNVHKTGSLGRYSICKVCRRDRHAIMPTMVRAARYRAKKKGLEFTITLEDVRALAEKQNNKCALTGVELNWDPKANRGSRRCPADRGSLDRIDSRKGYTLDNIQLLTDFANSYKSNYPLEDLLPFCRGVVKFFADAETS